ncbi:hypothetical protein KIPB_007219 [Kipferlia bialata]|uniref:Uncharacterized protein n=1 Tax=Kipferlia bialata TaxID=797122 RepID=A0A9K3D000_9EUKA|nr:hypothetical protein KIPB_007219 [Kipferlia bialata]|eukprot:g7219.t1
MGSSVGYALLWATAAPIIGAVVTWTVGMVPSERGMLGFREKVCERTRELYYSFTPADSQLQVAKVEEPQSDSESDYEDEYISAPGGLFIGRL